MPKKRPPVANQKQELKLSDFRAMAKRWKTWRDLLEPQGLIATNELLGPSRTKAFVALSRAEPLWKLAVSEAAYVNLAAPELARTREPMTLITVTNSLLLNQWQTEFPDFPKTAAHIAGQPFNLLVKATPRLSELLEQNSGLTASSFVCLDFCMKQHPEGGEALRLCVQSCSRGRR